MGSITDANQMTAISDLMVFLDQKLQEYACEQIFDPERFQDVMEKIRRWQTLSQEILNTIECG